MARYACGFLGNSSHAALAAELVFEIDECELLRFDETNSALVAHALNGRKLLLLGDSLTRQHFMELLCTLTSHDNATGCVHDTPSWVPFTHPPLCGARECSHEPGEKALLSSDHCYRFWLHGANFSLCHEFVVQDLDAALRSATRKFRLSEHDVILANVGAHGTHSACTLHCMRALFSLSCVHCTW
jgi:hypothetical protein